MPSKLKGRNGWCEYLYLDWTSYLYMNRIWRCHTDTAVTRTRVYFDLILLIVSCIFQPIWPLPGFMWVEIETLVTQIYLVRDGYNTRRTSKHSILPYSKHSRTPCNCNNTRQLPFYRLTLLLSTYKHSYTKCLALLHNN